MASSSAEVPVIVAGASQTVSASSAAVGQPKKPAHGDQLVRGAQGWQGMCDCQEVGKRDV
eukprot:9507843-Lingulodinium_polyedra.AAC.1